MKYIKRALESNLRQAAKTYKAVLLTGARQVGKSTAYEEMNYQGWVTFRHEVFHHDNTSVICTDYFM